MNSHPLYVLHLSCVLSDRKECPLFLGSTFCLPWLCCHHGVPTAAPAHLCSGFDAFRGAALLGHQASPPQALPLTGQMEILMARAKWESWGSEVSLQIKDLQLMPVFKPCNRATGRKTKAKMKTRFNECGGARGPSVTWALGK